MEKWMSLGSIGVAVIMFIVFFLDLVAGIPFTGTVPEGQSSPFTIVDIGGIIGALVVGYLGFNAYRDVR